MKNDKKQITLRIPDELYKALQKIDSEYNLSINSLVILSLLVEFGVFNNKSKPHLNIY